MGRLVSLAPTVGRLASGVGALRDAHGHSRVAEPWRRWYSLSRWRRLRWDVLVRDRFTCGCGCGRLEGDTSKLVADHIRPHRGEPALFWDPANLQTLTAACHSGAKQAAERASCGG